MSMEFMFAVVPFEDDGDLDELHNEVPDYGDFAEHLKDGVKVLQTNGEESLPDQLGLGLNITGIKNVNEDTNGAFLELTGGNDNQRYIRLTHRRQEALDRLRVAIPTMGTEFRRTFLRVFVENADAALKRHGTKAAIIIL